MGDMFLRNRMVQSCFCWCLVIGALITAGIYIPALNILALLAAAYCIAVWDKERIMCLMIFLMSFSPIFKMQIGSITFFNFLLLFSVLKLLNTYKMPQSVPSVLAFGGYILITSIQINFIETLTVICFLLLICILFRPDRQTYDLQMIVFFAGLGVVLTSMIAYFGSSIPRLSAILYQTRVRLEPGVYHYRFAGLMGNPNYYTMAVSIVLADIGVLIIEKKAGVIEYGMLVLLSVFGMMSISKSFIYSYALFVVILLGFYAKENPRNLVTGIVGCAVAGVLIYKLMGADTINTIFFRVQKDSYASIGDITTGRSELWQTYIRYILSNPLVLMLGRGIGAGNLSAGASHNFYIEMPYHLGIIGTILYLTCLISIFWPRTIRRGKHESYQYLPFLMFAIRAAARNLIASEQLVFLLLLCSLPLATDNVQLIVRKNKQ